MSTDHNTVMKTSLDGTVRMAVAVDDTDDLTKRTSTGEVAGDLAALAASLGGSVELGVTRHQLPRLDRIAYTSHNSAMAFTAVLPSETAFVQFHEGAAATVLAGSVDGSDPGLCIYRLPSTTSAGASAMRLLEYGARAKRVYVTKDEAYAVADSVPGLSLTEHGGGGEGVIGALAGVALRLSGSDGRFRGTVRLNGLGERLVRVAELVALLGGSDRAQVCDEDGRTLAMSEVVSTPADVKPVLFGSKITLIAIGEPSSLQVLDKKGMRAIEPLGARADHSCQSFEWDNDAEECEGETDARTCANCLWRRWTCEGVLCVHQPDRPLD